MIRNNGMRVVVAALALAGLTTGCDSEQPVPYCQVNNNGFIIKATKTGGTGTCAGIPDAQSFTDEWFFQRFIDSPTNPAGTIGITPVNTFTGEPSGVGITKFAADLPVNNVCSASEQPSAIASFDLDGDDEATPDDIVNISYRFDTTEVWVTANAPGTQVRGTFTYTETGANACTATFSYFGIAPVAECTGRTATNARTNVADPARCNTNPDPANNIPFGSGINPEFTTECRKVDYDPRPRFYCVPTANDFYQAL
jgi:hypothetical protein